MPSTDDESREGDVPSKKKENDGISKYVNQSKRTTIGPNIGRYKRVYVVSGTSKVNTV